MVIDAAPMVAERHLAGPVSFVCRMSEVRSRYPVDDRVTRALDSSMADGRSTVDRAECWISDAGLAGQV